ncbi:hypothetical protein [Nocardioides perillae]|uniref:Uncharacterized protein n=1 Tax=Nocardioides perillae TaxID=1119534 RepID=A0A7Y9RR24_9ACTN|nr:hypothetical protein [Nocardioides perillae]NYG54997.1 hypothetical protein [Nocardioides perillae]
MPRRVRTLLGAAVVAVVLAVGFVAVDRRPALDVPVGGPVAAPGTLVWASGTRLQVGDTAYDLDEAPDELVATRGGLYYLAGSTLHHYADGAFREVGEVGARASLVTSADGRWLGFVDAERGPLSLRSGRVAEFTVVDTTTGEVVARDATGNGARGQDLDALYAERPPYLLGFEDGAALVQPALGPPRALDLATGEGRDLTDAVVPSPPGPGGLPGRVVAAGDLTRFERDDGAGGRSGIGSPDGRRAAWVGEDVGGQALVFVLEFSEGRDLPRGLTLPRGRFFLRGWLDDTALVGSVSRPGGDGGVEQLVRCDVVAGRCAAVPGGRAAAPVLVAPVPSSASAPVPAPVTTTTASR